VGLFLKCLAYGNTGNEKRLIYDELDPKAFKPIKVKKSAATGATEALNHPGANGP